MAIEGLVKQAIEGLVGGPCGPHTALRGLLKPFRALETLKVPDQGARAGTKTRA
jgi:hypothetical protein